MNTCEGYQYTADAGTVQGLPCAGVIYPSSNISNSDFQAYDVAIIGAGYTGLIAARDLVYRGYKVLLMEARDRVGGRTWTSVIDGYPYEMGGTWVHWAQPYVWSELGRYDLTSQLEDSWDRASKNNHHKYKFDGVSRNISHDEEDETRRRLMTMFCDVDGAGGRNVIPRAHHPYTNMKEYMKWDSLSCADRLQQLSKELSQEDQVIMESLVVQMAGAHVSKVGFGDILRWWALSEYDADIFMTYVIRWKLKCGQSEFAKRIFQDALRSKNLAFAFSSVVTNVEQSSYSVSLSTQNGKTFTASRLICTIPLNVLNHIQFQPPLSDAKTEASLRGQINSCVKTHVEAAGPDYRSWSATGPPVKLCGIFGDGLTPAGNTHLVSFSANDSYSDDPAICMSQMKEEYEKIENYEIKRMLFHPWHSDSFARGTWCMYAPGFAAQYQRELQTPEGRVFFASADWADGWRGFIDGAIEQAIRAARTVDELMRGEKSAKL